MKNRNQILDFLEDYISEINAEIVERAKANFLKYNRRGETLKDNPYTLSDKPLSFIEQSNNLKQIETLNKVKKFLYSDANFYLLKGREKTDLAILFTDTLTEIINVPFKFGEFKVEEIIELNSLDVHNYKLKGKEQLVSELKFIDNNTYFCVEL